MYRALDCASIMISDDFMDDVFVALVTPVVLVVAVSYCSMYVSNCLLLLLVSSFIRAGLLHLRS